MNIARVLPDSSEYLDLFGVCPMRNLWQSPEWFCVLALRGMNPECFVVSKQDEPLAVFLLTTRTLPLGFSYSHLGRGPLLSEAALSLDLQESIYDAVLRYLRQRNVQYTLIDPVVGASTVSCLANLKSKEKGIIPDRTRVLNLLLEEEQLLSDMSRKGRYNILLSNRRGIRIEQSDRIDELHKMMLDTGQRKNIPVISLRDLEIMYRNLDSRIYLAYKKDTVTAASLCIIHHKTAYYYYGSHLPEYSRDMGAYALQWRMILDAKKAGCHTYDFYGTAPEGDSDHYLSKVSAFKARFGGRAIEYEKHRILINRPIRYWVFRSVSQIYRRVL